jgi:hypothetical protein
VTTKQFKIPMPRFGERRLSLYRPFWIAINPEFNPHEREVADSLPSPKRPSSRSRLPGPRTDRKGTQRDFGPASTQHTHGTGLSRPTDAADHQATQSSWAKGDRHFV